MLFFFLLAHAEWVETNPEDKESISADTDAFGNIRAVRFERYLAALSDREKSGSVYLSYDETATYHITQQYYIRVGLGIFGSSLSNKTVEVSSDQTFNSNGLLQIATLELLLNENIKEFLKCDNGKFLLESVSMKLLQLAETVAQGTFTVIYIYRSNIYSTEEYSNTMLVNSSSADVLNITRSNISGIDVFKGASGSGNITKNNISYSQTAFDLNGAELNIGDINFSNCNTVVISVNQSTADSVKMDNCSFDACATIAKTDSKDYTINALNPPNTAKSKNKTKTILIIVCPIVAFVLFCGWMVLCCFIVHRRNMEKKVEVEAME